MREREERVGERKNYVRKNVIECTHIYSILSSLYKQILNSIKLYQLMTNTHRCTQYDSYLDMFIIMWMEKDRERVREKRQRVYIRRMLVI